MSLQNSLTPCCCLLLLLFASQGCEPPEEPYYPPPPPVEQPRYETGIYANFLLRNETEQPVVLRTRALNPEVQMFCPVFDANPNLFSDALFLKTETYIIAPGTFHPINSRRADCDALLLESAEILPTLLYWNNGEYPLMELRAEQLVEGDRLISITGESPSLSAHSLLLPSPQPPEAEPGCEPMPPAQRLDWSQFWSGDYLLRGISQGADGCWALELDEERLFVCSPQMPAFELEATLRVDFGSSQLSLKQGEMSLHLDRSVPMRGGVRLACPYSLDHCGAPVSPLLETPNEGLGGSLHYAEDRAAYIPNCHGERHYTHGSVAETFLLQGAAR